MFVRGSKERMLNEKKKLLNENRGLKRFYSLTSPSEAYLFYDYYKKFKA